MKNSNTVSFSIHIDANRKKVWHILWNPVTYEKWTRVFMEGSHYDGEMRQGNTIRFLGKDGSGMSSLVEKLVENEQMVFAHQKEVKNGLETDSTWQGAREIYYLKETDTGTDLKVIIEVTPDMEVYFKNTFPKALSLVKTLTEQ